MSDFATNMTPEIRLAVETGVKTALKGVTKTAGDARDEVQPDQKIEGLTINMTLQIDELKVGHDTDKAPTASIPLLPTLALMAKRLGATREATLKMIREVMTEAISLDKDATNRLLDEAGVAEAQKMVKDEVIGKLPRTPVKKSVKVKGVNLTVTGVNKRAAAA